MKRLTLSLITLAATAAYSLTGYAASSGNLSVIGTIKPATCVTTIGGVADATFAYGKISQTRLLQSTITSLEVKSLPLKIVCDGPTKLAVTAVDNKSETNPFTTGTVDSSDAGESTVQSATSLFGLGLYGAQNDKKIGGFTLSLKAASAKLDGVQAYMARSMDNGATWSSTVYGQLGGVTDFSWRSWVSTSGGTTPAQASTFEADLMVKPWIQPRANLDLSGNILLDGSATIEVKYL